MIEKPAVTEKESDEMQTRPARPGIFYGWWIAATSFAILFVMVGIVYYSFPVFYAPLIEEFGWSRTQVTKGFFLSMALIGPLFGVSAGLLIDRYGPRRILMAGLVFAGVAFIGFARMHSLAAYYLFFFMQTIGYVSAGPIPNQVLVSRWFARMRGRVMGLAYVGIGVGGAIAPVAAQSLIRASGWRSAMLVIAGLVVLVLLPLAWLLVKDRPADLGVYPDGDAKPPAASTVVAPIALRRVMRQRNFWLVLSGSLLSIGAVGGVIQHLQLYLRDQRFTPEEAARVASLLLVSSIAGRVAMGYLADRFSKKSVMLAACLLVAGAIPLLLRVSNPGVAQAFALIFGFGMGADYILIPLITAECFGVASLGRLLGIVLTTDALSQALTPVLVGHLYDVQRHYTSGFTLLAAMALTGAGMVAAIAAPAERTGGDVPAGSPTATYD